MNQALEAWHEISDDKLKQLCELTNALFLNFKAYLVNTVEHLIIGCILYILTCIILYYSITKWKVVRFNRDIRNAKRILFVIAHPDDEVMFFGPTVLHYVHLPGCKVYLMCLSTDFFGSEALGLLSVCFNLRIVGKNYGMNSTRTKELYKSCSELGIEEENIFIHNHTNLPDDINVRWPVDIVATLILRHVQALNVTNLITFDRNGVSNHPNHTSIYYATASLILDRRLPRGCGVYVLESVNIIRKYWSIFDLPLSYLFSRFRYMEGFRQKKRIRRAMEKHKSQLMWFRKLYFIFSRFVLMNTLHQINLVDIELDLELEDGEMELNLDPDD